MAQVILRKRVIDCPSASWSVFGSKRKSKLVHVTRAVICQNYECRLWAQLGAGLDPALGADRGLIILMELL